jgi:hypothetical protein
MASGYVVVDAEGVLTSFGDLPRFRSVSGAPTSPIVDIVTTATGDGGWVLDASGAVNSFGATLHDPPSATLRAGERATSISVNSSNDGWWIFTDRGRAIALGSATDHGDLDGSPLNGPIVDSIATPDDLGYYLVAADGGVFAFGSAVFSGSMGGTTLNAPIRALVPDPDGDGYWLVAADGGVFAFGAPFRGSLGGLTLNAPVTGMVPYGDGYLMVAADGGVFVFSELPFVGSLGGSTTTSPVVAVAASS